MVLRKLPGTPDSDHILERTFRIDDVTTIANCKNLWNSSCVDIKGTSYTPLQAAMICKSTRIIDFLLNQRSLDVNAKNSKGENSLITAIQTKVATRILLNLFKKGVVPTLPKESTESSLLDYADPKWEGYSELSRALQRKKSATTDKDGATLKHIATVSKDELDTMKRSGINMQDNIKSNIVDNDDSELHEKSSKNLGDLRSPKNSSEIDKKEIKDSPDTNLTKSIRDKEGKINEEYKSNILGEPKRYSENITNLESTTSSDNTKNMNLYSSKESKLDTNNVDKNISIKTSPREAKFPRSKSSDKNQTSNTISTNRTPNKLHEKTSQSDSQDSKINQNHISHSLQTYKTESKLSSEDTTRELITTLQNNILKSAGEKMKQIKSIESFSSKNQKNSVKVPERNIEKLVEGIDRKTFDLQKYIGRIRESSKAHTTNSQKLSPNNEKSTVTTKATESSKISDSTMPSNSELEIKKKTNTKEIKKQSEFTETQVKKVKNKEKSLSSDDNKDILDVQDAAEFPYSYIKQESKNLGTPLDVSEAVNDYISYLSEQFTESLDSSSELFSCTVCLGFRPWKTIQLWLEKSHETEGNNNSNSSSSAE
ncbi:uncharacterized protein CMU_000670 [Cryptosporidium muris RN66]|uniref:Ankyrin repeat-containing protein n=1 Tax=Cryptosporidium muris (strain RN66) TaxID=441375 RepID=B6AG56_CRYMR|nr:uncharacterized protein CMU_000670 [Cryptosporidium muris RN66]EEA07197.1 hypothetical protein, conserved [Cryptosporidium muris RN66]|eukprot:XP_002141546.1 hypothetical protein [Cryptosporidium muris RN66]